ncbi:MAG TPA: prenyltransferase/squalene oxidase repeat-containing protein [Amycolatopsis sp.]|uniref:prenyltransferase/squalene oxidase repeat-containing protein n=1 Tax=Amycolatopsis sp. TaxID=37632 RepID=UPI002B4773DC|nr:prenyltransferase/squalene oxidase repeat-containing protein [Amycolatopsis sp.]HKS46533.1 prenyltransferase/squalene oxidase repeat-containing protein [Amycolatopsis sp.]
MMDPAAAAGVLADLSADPYGQFSPSPYETARLVTLAPDLAGHAGRMRFLLAEQNGDGGWGRPDGYGLLPTLSATEALLAELHRTRDVTVGLAAGRGLQALLTRLATDDTTLPDTVAVEVLVPGLVLDINTRLDDLDAQPWPALHGRRLPYPKGTNPEPLWALREAVRQGKPLPPKLVHSLEAIGPAAQGFSSVRPGIDGLGCSPAATAAWLGNDAMTTDQPGVRYLKTVQARHGGPVPVAAPLGVFERSWVLATLLGAGVEPRVPPAVATSLYQAVGDDGVAGGTGLLPDADDTACTLHALALLGTPLPLDCLWAYQHDDHFVTYPEERTPSVTTNAHVLQAFATTGPPTRRVTKAMRMLTTWLCGRQGGDGTWSDKWHASEYYATFCCVSALTSDGESTAAVRKAVRWVVGTQRTDGSWGRWEGTPEETAYAVQILLHANGGKPDPAIEQAAARGCAYLLATEGVPNPPLWHDKDLYTPDRIVLAQRIAVLHAATANPRIGMLVGPWADAVAGRTA